MAISFVNVGSGADGVGAVTPGEPSGVQTDDILILHIEGEGEDTSADGGPTSWNLIDSVASATDGTADRTRHTLYWIRYDSGSPPSYSVPDAGNHTLAYITAWRGCTTSGSPIHTYQTSSNSTNSTSLTVTGLTTTVDDCMIVWSVSAGDDSILSTCCLDNNWGNTTLGAPTDCANTSTTSGSDGSIRTAYSLMSGQGSTGNTTNTIANSEEVACFAVALIPAIVPVEIPVGAGSLTVTGYAPVVDQSFQAAPSSGSVAITGYDLTVDIAGGDLSIPIEAGSLAITGQTPSVSSSIAIGAGSISIEGHTSVIEYAVHIGTGALLWASYQPNLAYTYDVASGQLTIQGYGPTVQLDYAIPVGAGALAISGHAILGPVSIDIPAGSLSISSAGGPVSDYTRYLYVSLFSGIRNRFSPYFVPILRDEEEKRRKKKRA